MKEKGLSSPQLRLYRKCQVSQILLAVFKNIFSLRKSVFLPPEMLYAFFFSSFFF